MLRSAQQRNEGLTKKALLYKGTLVKGGAKGALAPPIPLLRVHKKNGPRFGAALPSSFEVLPELAVLVLVSCSVPVKGTTTPTRTYVKKVLKTMRCFLQK